MLLSAFKLLLGLELVLTVVLSLFLFVPRFDDYVTRTFSWRDVGYYTPIYVGIIWIANGWTCFVLAILFLKGAA